MSTWTWILIACAIAYATKLVGYLLPQAWLEQPRVQRTAAGMTVGLLASLVAVNTFVTGTALTFDARVAALVAAAIALLLRAPFLVVVVVGAGAAAGGRALGFCPPKAGRGPRRGGHRAPLRSPSPGGRDRGSRGDGGGPCAGFLTTQRGRSPLFLFLVFCAVLPDLAQISQVFVSRWTRSWASAGSGVAAWMVWPLMLSSKVR